MFRKSPSSCKVGANLKKKMITLTHPKMKKWKNMVNVCAAESYEKIKLLTYVKGKIAIGKTKKVTHAVSKPISNASNSITVMTIVNSNFKKSNMKLPSQ